jgi:glycosyltransferase involved in cell wall biosynthesis
VTVVYDLLGVQHRQHGERGIARYVTSLALAIERAQPRLVDHYLVSADLPVPGSIEPLLRTGRVEAADLHRPPGGAETGVFVAGSLFEFEYPLEQVLPVWARSPGWRRAAILYDLIPLRFPEQYLADRTIRRQYLARADALRSFDHLLAISQASADDATELLGIPPQRITVIGAGADRRFRPPDARPDQVVRQLQGSTLPELADRYLLFPSGIDHRKNIGGLLEAYASLPGPLRRERQLVLVCRINDDERAELDERARTLGLHGQLLVTGFVSDDTLVRLYQGAELVVFPSLYEGFGLPVLEGRQCGAPVICGDNSSLREVQPDPSARFDAGSAAAIATTLERCLSQPAELDRLRAGPVPAFTWELAAERTASVLRGAQRRPRKRRRRRLAVVTPVPPQPSGIATYAGRILAPLADELDVTVFADELDPDTSLPAGIGLSRTEQLPMLERSGLHFDRVLYFLGNSSFHVQALAMLRQRPGAVLFHDARLTGLYLETFFAAPRTLPGGTVGGALADLYPGRYRTELEELDVIPPDLADRYGILMAREVARHATSMLVHSHFAATLLELDTGRRPEVAFPIPVPDWPDDPVAAPGPPVIASFGVVSPIKRPDLLIRALPEIRRVLPETRLHFVGGCPSSVRDELTALIGGLGLEDAVLLTDHVDDERFRAEYAGATVAVQLRAFTNGESSAAVTDAIAAGVPAVVTDIGAMAELPDDVVLKVPVDVEPADLARALTGLLTDNERREAMGRAAAAYAAEHTYERAARRLVELVFGS